MPNWGVGVRKNKTLTLVNVRSAGVVRHDKIAYQMLLLVNLAVFRRRHDLYDRFVDFE